MARALLGGVSGVEIRRQLLAGELSCSELAVALIDAVGEDPLHAWAAFDPELVRRRAAALEALDGDRREALPLFGIPVAIKDVFDTTQEPTAYGSPIYAGRHPPQDAAAVVRLRAAGALIAGKVTTAEFAVYSPPATLNPLDPSRTPGGSSSGSGAAVGAGTVPLATGTQTGGSIGRPASYCGVLGYKPTFGLIDRTGVRQTCETLDTIGMLGRDLEDLRLASVTLGVQSLTAGLQRFPVSPRLAFARTPLWSQIEPEAATAIEEWAEETRAEGVRLDEVELPGYARLGDLASVIQDFGVARSLATEIQEHPAELSDVLRDTIARGSEITESDYRAACSAAARLSAVLTAGLAGHDAILTPSTTGVPSIGVGSSGSGLFCRAWTLAGVPSLSIPLVTTTAGLPAGLQLVAPAGEDHALFSVAAWLLCRASTGAERLLKKP